MTIESDGRGVEINRGLLVSGVVLGSIGALLGVVGGGAALVALVGAARSWVGGLEEPPSAMARRTLAQARLAALAGAQAWQQNGSYQSASRETVG